MSKQICNEQGEIEEYQKGLRTWLFEEESFVSLTLFQDGKAYSIVTDHLGTPVEAYNELGEEVWCLCTCWLTLPWNLRNSCPIKKTENNFAT